MHRVHMHVLAFWIGFVCGTLGLFLLALLRELFSFIDVVAAIFFMPSRFFADLFTTNGLVSGAMLIFLYILTGTFYGLSASFLEEGWMRMKRGR